MKDERDYMINESVSWTHVVTAIVAIFAFILSIINFIMSWLDRNNKVIIKISKAQRLFNNTSTPIIETIIINKRKFPINIQRINIKLPDKKIIHILEDMKKTPLDIPSMSSIEYYYNTEMIINAIKKEGFTGKIKIYVIVKDGIGNIFKSNKLFFQIKK